MVVQGNLSLLRYRRIDEMDFICHLAGNKNCDNDKSELAEELKMNNKELMQSGYQLNFN